MANTKTSLFCILLLGSAISLLGEPSQPAWGKMPTVGPAVLLTVDVTSGRRFTAELDVRTDARQLWLRWNSRSGHLLRPIDWERVERVELRGETYTGRELREAVAVAWETLPAPPPSPASFPEALQTSHPEPLDAGLVVVPPLSSPPLLPPPPSFAAAHRFEPPRVRSLAIEARIANWDSDVEMDGLLLDIFPLDGAGFVLPVRGTIQVELIGEETGTTRSRQPYALLGRWTEQVCPVDFHTYGARYKLPFRQVHPEFDLRWAPKGLVNVRLSVPGEGVFESSQSMVRVRPFSAIRDRLEQTTGQRFFEEERTGR